MLVDSHIHCHELPPDELESYKREWTLICVSDDVFSSVKTLQLTDVVKCVGIHPWQVDKADPTALSQIARIVTREEILCLGEVGLDKRFVPHTYDKQLEFFRQFLRLAKELGLVLNVHAPDAWQEAVEWLRRIDVDKALIHWYTGPLWLLETIRDLGFYISINPAVEIQRKHQEVAKAVDRRTVVLESDGPYQYRGIRLAPPAILRTVEILAKLWETSPREVVELTQMNAKRLWRL